MHEYFYWNTSSETYSRKVEEFWVTSFEPSEELGLASVMQPLIVG